MISPKTITIPVLVQVSAKETSQFSMIDRIGRGDLTASNLGVGVSLQASVQNSVGDLVAHLV